MRVRAVGFDLDYTLAVPERTRARLLDEAASAVDAPPLDRAAYLDAHRENLTGETRAPIFEDLLADHETEVSPHEVARSYRERVNEALAPVAGVEGLLSALRDRYRVGLLTNGPSVAQRAKIATLGWEDAFDAALVSGELAAGKPDERAFAALCERLSCRPGALVYVGDEREADVAGALGAGLRVVQVLFPDGPDPDPRADALVDRDALASTLPDVLDDL